MSNTNNATSGVGLVLAQARKALDGAKWTSFPVDQIPGAVAYRARVPRTTILVVTMADCAPDGTMIHDGVVIRLPRTESDYWLTKAQEACK